MAMNFKSEKQFIEEALGTAYCVNNYLEGVILPGEPEESCGEGEIDVAFYGEPEDDPIIEEYGYGNHIELFPGDSVKVMDFINNDVCRGYGFIIDVRDYCFVKMINGETYVKKSLLIPSRAVLTEKLVIKKHKNKIYY